MIITNSSSFPFFLGLSKRRVGTVSILMTDEVDEVRMSHCCVPMSVYESISTRWYFTYLQSLREDIHSKDFISLFGISLLTNNAFRSTFFLKSGILKLFHKFISIFLHLHLLHNFFFLLLSQSLFLFVLLVYQLLQVLLHYIVINLVFVG
jgi:hypothetical protein